MKAVLLIDRREQIADQAFVELVLWRVLKPVPGCTHRYKYRLAYIVKGVCVLRFDNESGKGDHKHVGRVETSITVTDPDQLLTDFKAEMARWNHENRHP